MTLHYPEKELKKQLWLDFVFYLAAILIYLLAELVIMGELTAASIIFGVITLVCASVVGYLIGSFNKYQANGHLAKLMNKYAVSRFIMPAPPS